MKRISVTNALVLVIAWAERAKNRVAADVEPFEAIGQVQDALNQALDISQDNEWGKKRLKDEATANAEAMRGEKGVSGGQS